MTKVLFTSVCRPFGPEAGDSPSVGYELLHAQVTRSQGVFSPRAVHHYFGLDYIAENIDASAVVLQYPSQDELAAELAKGGYDYVGVNFVVQVFHKMKETVAVIRKHAPRAKIVLGGYGTFLPDEVLSPLCDHVCREEGVAFFRRLLGEAPKERPYAHPLVVSTLKLFSLPVSKTGMVFAGLGCANGCDFCCTSNFFKRKHIRLLDTGKQIYDVIERYLDLHPDMSFTILDEDFLLNKRRALEFKECVQKAGKPLSIFVFSSIRAISQYTPKEILEMGIDGFWIGYEGTRSGYSKQQGRAPEELFPDLARHGITVLASMIVGFDYQTPEVIAEELDGLLKLKPCLSQFLIYTPNVGTPFYERVVKEGRMRPVWSRDREAYYKVCDGFTSLVTHPTLSAKEIEDIQRGCFREDYRRLGPSIYRVVERWLDGHLTLKGAEGAYLQAKSAAFAKDVRKSYPIFLPGKLLAPAGSRERISALERRAYAALGAPTFSERLQSVAALGAALWTGLCLKLGWFQHPGMTRTAYRPQPSEAWTTFPAWQRIPEAVAAAQAAVRVDLDHARQQVWLRLEGRLGKDEAERLWAELSRSLEECKGRVVLDMKKLQLDPELSRSMASALEGYRRRLRVILPQLQHAHPELLLVAQLFRHYQG